MPPVTILNNMILCVFVLLILTPFNCVLSYVPCARFQFPTIQHGLNISLAEGENITILFNISFGENCSVPERFVVQVSKLDNYTDVQCSLLHEQGVCQQPRTLKCTCNNEDGVYTLFHTAHRTDNRPTEWEWSSDYGHLQNLSITFNVTYAAVVTSLFPHPGHIFQPNKPVDIICTWDAGNPPVAVLLLDRHGAILNTSSDVTGEIRYRFDAVGCEDAGLIHCQAPGASRKLSVPLLVRCMPKIATVSTLTNPDGTTYQLKLHVRSHAVPTAYYRLTGHHVSVTCNVTAVSGSPPDFTVTVLLDTVRKQDKGTLHLSMTNDVGTAYHKLQLDAISAAEDVEPCTTVSAATEPYTTPGVRSTSANGKASTTSDSSEAAEKEKKEPNNQEPEIPTTSWMTAGAAAVFAVVIVCSAACHLYRRKSASAVYKSPSMMTYISRYHSERGSQPELPRRGRSARSDECVMIPNFLYGGSGSLLHIPDNVDPRERGLSLFYTKNRSAAPLPEEVELEGDYAVVGENQDEESDGYQACASANDYVPIKEVQARKRKAETAAQSASEAEADTSFPASDQTSVEETKL